MSYPAFKPPLLQFTWLLLALALSFVLAGYFVDWRFSREVAFHFFDTYYIVAFWMVILPLFSFISFLLFLLKEIRNRFSKKLPVIIIICTGILSIAVLSFVTKFMPVISGYTLYPPLSGLSDHWIDAGYDREMIVLASLTIAIQVIVATIIVYVAYRLGVAKRKAG